MLDEFASFIEANPNSFNTFLSQSRKSRVLGCFANQYWSQTTPSLRRALQNCGIRVAFRQDYDDAIITSRMVGRMKPNDVSVADGPERESVGMPEQWQGLVQELRISGSGRPMSARRFSSYRFP